MTEQLLVKNRNSHKVHRSEGNILVDGIKDNRNRKRSPKSIKVARKSRKSGKSERILISDKNDYPASFHSSVTTQIPPSDVDIIANGGIADDEMKHIYEISLQGEQGNIRRSSNTRPSRRGSLAQSFSSVLPSTYYPEDSFSFIALFSPFDNFIGFFFGFAVFSFQCLFLLMLILNIMYPKWSSYDNSDGIHAFIPGDVEPVVKFSQYLAVLAFGIFADSSIKDVIIAIDMLPRPSMIRKEDKLVCLFLSSFLRLTQGVLSILVSFLLIFTASTVIDIVLNFTAINFISSLDDQAFEMARHGHYGGKIKRYAKKITEEKLPSCITKKECRMFRKNFVLLFVFVNMVVFGGMYSMKQQDGSFVTSRLRVEFDRDGPLSKHSGCYTLSKEIPKSVNGYRFTYEYYNPEVNDVYKFGYCKESYQWFFFENTESISNAACNAWEERKVLAYSSKTTAFDIQSVFANPWFLAGGSYLKINFLERNSRSGPWSDDQCAQFLGDGNCYEHFNVIDYEYDGGDCCGASCEGSNCGLQMVKTAFGTELKSTADGFPTCKDPEMIEIIININSIIHEEKENFFMFTQLFNTTPPLMILECEGKPHLMLHLEDEMVNNNETVKVTDGAECQILVRNEYDLSIVNYEIYHRVESGIDIKILNGDNNASDTIEFKVIPNCYFQALSHYFDLETIYSRNNSQSKAIRWLLDDKTGHSDCYSPFFIERYALAAINFEATANNDTLDGLWVEKTQHCTWLTVNCNGGYVDELFLNFNYVNGSIGTEIGLLTKLVYLNAEYVGFTGTIPSELGNLSELENLYLRGDEINHFGRLTGTIPPELGNLLKLKDLFLDGNNLSGSIPSKLGSLLNLEYLDLSSNHLTGTIPPTLGSLSNLYLLALNQNSLSGNIPTELSRMSALIALELHLNNLSWSIPFKLGKLSNLIYLTTYGNDLTGTIPPELGQLAELEQLDLSDNHLSFTLPTYLGKLSKLQRLVLHTNDLSGSIPSEYGQLSELRTLDIRGNNLSGSIPSQLGALSKLSYLLLDQNGLTGSIPSELGDLSGLQWLHLRNNRLTGTVPSELGRMINLEQLYLTSNSLVGGLNPVFCNNEINRSTSITVTANLSNVDCVCCASDDVL